MAVTTTPFPPSAMGPPFSYGIPSSGTSPVLSYSTSKTLRLGAGSSNAPLQGHIGGTSTPFNTFPYGGGHIPPRPLRSVALISNLLGHLHTIVYLE
jgi:hypothetical protein